MKVHIFSFKMLSLLLIICLLISVPVTFAADEEDLPEDDGENIIAVEKQRNNEQDQLEIVFNEKVDAKTRTLNLVVDESKVISHPTADWYGINDGTVGNVLGTENAYYEKDGRGPDGLKMNMEMVNSIKNFKGTVSVVRYGGTFSNYADWKKAAYSDWAERQPYTAMYWDTDYEDAESDALSIVDFCKTFLAVNKDMKFHIVVNMTTDTEIDVADLAEFLQGDGVINHNGGENWAQRRISMGIKEPIKNITYELGNEIEWSTNAKRRDWTKENYVAVARRFIAAIRSVNEDAHISAITPCAVWSRLGDEWMEWHRYVLMEIGDQIDTLDYHAYNAYRQGYVAAGTVESLADDIKQVTGSNRIKIFQSESGSSSNTGTRYGYKSLAFGINLTDYYYRLINLPGDVFEGATWHSLTNYFRDVNKPEKDDWALTMQQWDGSYINVPFGEARDFLSRYGVGDALYMELDDFNFEKPSWVSGAVVKQGDKINVMLTNLSDVNNYNISMKFNNKYKLVHSYVMTAPKLTSVVWRTKNEVEIKEMDYSLSKPIDSFLLQSKSMVCLQLEPIEQ